MNPREIILFGSYARGDATPDSDMDLLIVEDEPFGLERSRSQEMALLWKVLAGFMIAKDILVFSSDEIERWKGTKTHVIARAYREGKILYERH